MSYTSDVKLEVSLQELNQEEKRAALSALLQMTSSLSISSRGLALLSKTENAAVSRAIYRYAKDLYDVEITPSVKRKMNLNKNLIYRLRMEGDIKSILQDLGIYSSRGLLDCPLKRIVTKDNCARAYLAGAFMAEGSVNAPTTPNYHLEIKAGSEKHADFMIDLAKRFYIEPRKINRRKRWVIYVKAAEKIADFMRCIGASECLLQFEDARITRDLSSSVTRLNNVEVANEVKSMEAATKQLEDIKILEEYDMVKNLDQKLKDVIALRLANPEGSLNELADQYRAKTGVAVSKSGIKHRFVKIHELALKAEGKHE